MKAGNCAGMVQLRNQINYNTTAPFVQENKCLLMGQTLKG